MSKYKLKNNYSFLKWYNKALEKGIKVFYTIEELQELIDKMVYNYNEVFDSTELNDFIYILKDTYTEKEKNLLECNYNSSFHINVNVNDTYVMMESVIINTIPEDNEIQIFFDKKTGVIFNKEELNGFGIEVYDNMTIDELYLRLNNNKYNKVVLKSIIDNHKAMSVIRKTVINYIYQELKVTNESNLISETFVKEAIRYYGLRFEPDISEPENLPSMRAKKMVKYISKKKNI